MTSPKASPSRSNSKDLPLVFLSTSTAVFSESSRTAARSHAAAWSRRRLREAKARPSVCQGFEPQGEKASTSSTYPKVGRQKSRHGSDKKEWHGQRVSRELEEQLNLSVGCRRSDVNRSDLSRENLLMSKRHLGNLSLAVCGKNGALDPFDSLAVKVDSNAYDLLHFYKLFPMAWDSQPYALNQNNLDGDNGNIVSSCMSSKLHFYTFLSLSAAVMETLGITEIGFPRAVVYSQYALTEIQIHLRREQVNEPELLHGVSTLSIAAAIQGDVAAARAHLRAAKYLVDRLGGFEALSPMIAQHIRYSDFHLAIETLSPPVFVLDFEPVGHPELQYIPDPLLEQMRQDALQASQMHLSPYLSDNVQQILQCAGVLNGVWAKPTLSSIETVEWLASKIMATMNLLLSITFETTSESQTRKAQEATKVILILWNLITLMFAKRTTVDAPVRSSMPVFRNLTLEMMREYWPPWIYLGLMSWNAIVRSPMLDVEDSGTFWSLINVVRSMEAEGLVHLAVLMDRLYQLEDTYRIQRRQPQDIEFVLR